MQHQEFLIRTDQKSLVHLEEQKLTTVWQQKAFTKLLGMQYKMLIANVSTIEQLTLCRGVNTNKNSNKVIAKVENNSETQQWRCTERVPKKTGDEGQENNKKRCMDINTRKVGDVYT